MVTTLVAAISMAMVVRCTLRDDRLETNFGKIKPGMAPSDVIQLLGKPSWDTPCESHFPYDPQSGCAREFGYAYGLAPLNPLYYMVWFGKDGRVLEIYEISSP